MDWIHAESSMLKSYRFMDRHVVDGVPFGTLEITWTNGSRGAYLDVNERTYEEFAGAKSHGKFLNTVIKPNFAYKRQEPEDVEGQEKPADETEGSEGSEGRPKA